MCLRCACVCVVVSVVCGSVSVSVCVCGVVWRGYCRRCRWCCSSVVVWWIVVDTLLVVLGYSEQTWRHHLATIKRVMVTPVFHENCKVPA